MIDTRTTGVLGRRWRASVTPYGGLEPWDGSAALDWHVAADDRWHSPATEAAVRQTRLDGAPVYETRVRIPMGDVVHRAWSVADAGGVTVIEVENDSPLPIAVALTRGDVLTARPPSATPIQGIDLPTRSVLFPVGHHSSVTVALAHDRRGAGPLPANLSSSESVARGWHAVADRAGRFVLPEQAVVDRVVALRCELALRGSSTIGPSSDPVDLLLAAGQLVRMGEAASAWVPDVAAAVELVLRHARGATPAWDGAAALDAAGVVFAAADEQRASRDLAAIRARIATLATPADAPDGVRLVAWLERRFADGRGRLLPDGFPVSWLGSNVEVHDMPIAGRARLSLAIRWHGARPAVLWEVTDGDGIELTAPVAAPSWRATASSGEALWPAPVATAVETAMTADISFG